MLIRIEPDPAPKLSVALAVGVPLYLAWAVLLDAAVHGWDDLKQVP
jgi:hypothetical protein